VGHIFRSSYLCAAGLPRAADVLHDCDRGPKQRQEGNDRDEEKNAHTYPVRIPKQAVRKSASVDRVTMAVYESGSSPYFVLLSHAVLRDT
jgi:hypothetical protein